MTLISIFTELAANGRVVIPSANVKSFHRAAVAHGMRYEIGPHTSGQSVLITI